MNFLKRNSKFLIYALFAFVAVFLFYAVIDPIAVLDTDDWSHSYILRMPIPIIRAWNPTRVFPEVFEPLVAYFGAYVIYPMLGNYTYSLTIAHSLFISFILAIYFYEFVVMIYNRVSRSEKNSIFTGVLFLVLHFIAFLHIWGNNETLLHSWDLSCLYYYTAASALNAALVMHIVSRGEIDEIKNYSLPHKLLVIIWGYFSIFSNLYSSIVLAAYFGADLIIRLRHEITSKQFTPKRFAVKNSIHVLALGIWMLSHVIEKTGGRSGSRAGDIFASLRLTLVNLLTLPFHLNVFVFIFSLAVVILWKRKCKKEKMQIQKLLLCFFLTIAYLFLLCVVVDSLYMTRPDVIIAFAFWVLIGLMGCFSKLISENKKYELVTLILLGSIVMFVIGHSNMFRPMNYGDLQYEQCEAIMNDIIAQFRFAEEEGLDEIDLVVPKFDTDNNWPISASEYSCERYQELMYRHHLVGKRIRVKSVVPSEEKSELFFGTDDM